MTGESSGLYTTSLMALDEVSHMDVYRHCKRALANMPTVDAVYINGAMKVRVTLADTAGDPAALAVLATMVVTLPDNYSATIDGAASVSRVTFKGSPAAMRWDPVKLDGEFVVIVGGRFVAKAEGTGIDSIEALRGFVEQVDLKALAELK